MNNFIIGTAGHIDHGKTELIKSLTGIETDRLKEEKKRGISIELGFTYINLPDGQKVGIVDVPGHEKFIKNMLAGASGIDLVILVVAANEGFMPQTVEHLDILNMLNIKNGFIVLTKTDLVDKEWIDLVKEDIKDRIKGTFLENTSIIEVSNVNKDGIEDVKKEIFKYSNTIEREESNKLPRLPIDRVFTISGHGTIVTGTLNSGFLNIGESIEIYPSRKISRIRSIQVHDKPVDIAYAGQRVAINLANVKKDEIQRGDILAKIDSMENTMMLDAKIKLLESFDKVLENRTRVRVYIGAKEVLARVVILNKKCLYPGEEAYVQLRLEEKISVDIKDRFIIRFYSPMYTIGGGLVLNSNPNKHKRFDDSVINSLRLYDTNNVSQIIYNFINDANESFLSFSDISKYIPLYEEVIIKYLKDLKVCGKIIELNTEKDFYYTSLVKMEKINVQIIDYLKNYHNSNPLKQGVLKEEFKNKFFEKLNSNLYNKYIDYLIKQDIIEYDKEFIKLKEFQIKENKEIKESLKIISKLIEENGYKIPKIGDVFSKLHLDMEEDLFYDIVNIGKINGNLVKINNEYFITKRQKINILNRLEKYFEEYETISVAAFRDLLRTNRKISIAILEYLDFQKITIRKGDTRIFNKK